MPQVQQQVGLSSSVQVQAALDKVARKRLVVQREERDRVREAIGLQSLLQGGDALTHIGAVPPLAARVRPVVKVNALQPDDAASGGAQGESPIQIHPEMAAAPRVLDRLRRGEADRDAHRAPSVDTASVRTADSNSGCPRAARSAAAYRYDARCDGPSGTPLHPGMLHMSTT